MFDTLLRAFEASLLHAYRSKFTQFLLFWVRRGNNNNKSIKLLSNPLLIIIIIA